MKKRILIISILLTCLIVPSVLVIAKNYKPAAESLIASVTESSIAMDFKLDMFMEGQLLGNKLVGTLVIWKFNDRYDAHFSSVHIIPLHNEKKVFLASRHFSTTEGSMKNVFLNKNGFSFRIESIRGWRITADIVGKRRKGKDAYSIEASAIVDVIVDKEMKKTTQKWVSTDKKIVLPYKEVF